jgi:hypothetical protein
LVGWFRGANDNLKIALRRRDKRNMLIENIINNNLQATND